MNKMSMANDKEEVVRECPMFKTDCKKLKCGWYNPIIDVCSVQTLPYNLYKHSIAVGELSETLRGLRGGRR